VNRNPSLNNRLARKRLCWLTGICLLGTLSLQAQDDTIAPLYEDTVETRTTIEVAPVESVEEEEAGSEFLPLSMVDSIRLQLRKVPDSVVQGLQQQDAFWYANATIEKEKEAKKPDLNYKPFSQRPWFKTILWLVIIVVFLGVVIFYLADSNFGMFRRNKKVPSGQDPDLNEMPEDIFAISYQQEIDKAVANADYRLAVRLQYLRLLKNMTEKSMIRYQQDKTNMDYLMQLADTGYYHDFFRITRHYEYSWYGQFTVSAEAYRLITQDVEQFENRR
jgi:hypothetical protein